jgi:hypothetical protein
MRIAHTPIAVGQQRWVDGEQAVEPNLRPPGPNRPPHIAGGGHSARAGRSLKTPTAGRVGEKLTALSGMGERGSPGRSGHSCVHRSASLPRSYASPLSRFAVPTDPLVNLVALPRLVLPLRVAPRTQVEVRRFSALHVSLCTHDSPRKSAKEPRVFGRASRVSALILATLPPKSRRKHSRIFG